MNPLIAVVADDLTGVCDTGAQFASSGLRTIGSVDEEFLSEDIPDVMMINTRSRSLEGPAASRRVEHAVSRLKRFKPKWFFKKIDTALRGNIAAEVIAMMETLGVNIVLYVAAIPVAGRTTVGGCQFFQGIPIRDSIHGEDRFNPNPIPTSSNPELFSRIEGLETKGMGLDEVRSSSLDISGIFESPSKKIVIFDCETDEDIDRIVGASMRLDPSSFFFVGSFGLSSAMGRYLKESLQITEIRPTVNEKMLSLESRKKMLIVSGSSHPMARSQISCLRKEGRVEVIEFEPEGLVERPDSCAREATRVLRRLRGQNKGVVLTIGEGESSMKQQSQDLVVALAEVVRRLLESNGIDGLLLVGGETGDAVCRALGIGRIEVFGNVASVAAYGKPLNGPAGIKVLVTKGGSLGEENTLQKILTFFDPA